MAGPLKPYYTDDHATIYNGDCLDVMRQLPADTFDLVFTSPPYNLGMVKGTSTGGKNSLWRSAALAEGYADYDDARPYAEYVSWQNDVLRECWRLIKPTGAIYYQHKPRVLDGVLRTPLGLIPDDLPVRQIVIWDRASGFNFTTTQYVPTHEWIVVIARPEFRLKNQGASSHGDVWRVPPARGNRHPAPFPLSLPAKAIESTDARMILDPFMGSGTTLRAAADVGARSVGIELAPAYCDMAVERLAQQALDLGALA